MGKCLSCCEDHHGNNATHNGHAVPPASHTPLPPSIATVSLQQKYRASAHTDPPNPIGGGQAATRALARDPFHTSETKTPMPAAAPAPAAAAASDKKTFGPYAKLPPIRKHSSGSEGKRMSAVPRSSGGGEFSEQKIHLLFDHYRDSEEEDAILAEGIERFCQDLNVKPEEFRVLVLAWKFDAQQMCYFSRSELVDGCKKLHVDSIRGIQARFPDLLHEVQAKQTFKDLYRWTYKFGLESGQRTLPTEVAIVLWKLVFHQNEPPILDRWLDFLSSHPSIRGIPKDTWDMFLNLTEAVGDDLSSYDDTEAWPSLFDDFVEYENDRQNQNVTNKDIKICEEF